MHQRWKARQENQGKHPQYEGDEYSGEEMVREGDGLEMIVEEEDGEDGAGGKGEGRRGAGGGGET